MNSAVTDLAGVLSSSLANGNGSARASIGGDSIAFSWAPTVLNGLVRHIDTVQCDGTQFRSISVANTTAVGPWTGGADKPVTAVLEHATHDLACYPAYTVVKSRDILDSANLGAAIHQSLYGQALRGFDKALVSGLMGASLNGIAKAADLAAIAEGQAMLLAAGFTPSVVAVSPALYGTLAGASMLVGGNNPQDAQQSVLGSRVVVSSALTGAQALVLDSAAVVAAEAKGSPSALVSVDAKANSFDVVVEIFAGYAIRSDEGVVAIKAATK